MPIFNPIGTGGAGTPGGAVTSIQFNDSGTFNGFGTWDGTYLSLPNGQAFQGQYTNLLGSAYINPDGSAVFSSGNAFFDNAGNLTVAGFKLTTSPSAGYVLTSDGSGNGTWQVNSGGLPDPINDDPGGITGNISVDYVNHGLYYTGAYGSTIAFNYGTGQLFSPLGTESLNIYTHLATNSNGDEGFDWSGDLAAIQIPGNTALANKPQLMLYPDASYDPLTFTGDGGFWNDATSLWFRQNSVNYDLIVWSRYGGNPNQLVPTNITDGLFIPGVTNTSGSIAINTNTAPSTEHLLLGLASSSSAHIRFLSDTSDVTSPADGMLWYNDTNLYFRSGGVNHDLLAGGGGTVTSVSGTTNRITSTGGTTPVIDISASYVGQSSITTLGTIGTGTWSATTIALNKGGTGQTTKAAAFDALSPMTTGGDLIYGGASGTGTRLANGTAGQFLKSNGTTLAPSWATSSGSGDVTQATSGTQTSGNISFWNTTAKELSKGDSLFNFDSTLRRIGVGVTSPQATSHNVSSTAETLAPLATASATLNLFTAPLTPTSSYATQATGHMYAVTSPSSYQNSLGVVSGTSATINYGGFGYVANGRQVDYVIYSKNSATPIFAGSACSPFTGGTDANDSSNYQIDLLWSGGSDTLTADAFRIYRQVNGGGYGEYVDVGNVNAYSDTNSGWNSGSTPPTPQITGFTATGTTHDYKIYQGGTDGSGGYIWSVVSAISTFGDNFSGNVYNVTISWTQNTSGTATPIRYRIYRQISGGGYTNYFETSSTTITDNNIGWTAGSSPTPQYPDYIATGTARSYLAYGRFLTPNGDNIYSAGNESYGFTDDNSGNPYVVNHSLAGSTRTIGSPSGSASGYHVDSVTGFTENSTSWISGDTVTPTTYGIQSDGTTLNRDYRLYNKGFTAGQNIYSAYLTRSVSDPNDSNYYYVTLAFTGYAVEAKVARSINGGGFAGPTHISTTTFADDGTLSFSDSATVGPTSVYPPAGFFGSPDSDSVGVSPTVIVKSTTSTHPRLDFLDSADSRLAIIGVTALGFNTNGLYLKDIASSKLLAFSNSQVDISGPLIVDGPIKSKYIPASGGALAIYPNGSDVTAKLFGDYTGTQDIIQFFTSAGSATGYAKFTTTSTLVLRTGGTAAGSDPLKFVSGSLLTTPVVGVEEFLTDKRYITITTGTARKEHTLNDIALTSTRVPFSTTNGRLTDVSGFSFASSTLTVPDLIDSGLTASKFVLSDGSKKLVSGTAALQVAAGIPTVVASTFEKAETGTDANVLTYTSGGADEYLTVQVSADVSAITGTSVVATVTWKDSNNSTATSSVTLTAVGDGTINVPINCKTATNVVVSTVFIGVSTAYNISAYITRLK